jgi:hypothetical protein
MNLKEFVELWKTTMNIPSPPTVFISQKLTPEQDEKIDTLVTPYIREKGCVLHSVDRLRGYHDPRPVYRYKFIPSDNIADFQVKPPVKTLNSNL